MKDRVSVTDHIKEFSIEKKILKEYFFSDLNKETTIALVWHKLINRDFFENYPKIRAVVRYGVGYDNIDLEYCKRNKIIVSNTPDYGVDEVADTALAMILSLTRKINKLSFLAKEDGNYWLGKSLNINMKRINKLKLGIIGCGRIGSSIGLKFKSFSNHVGFYDPYLPDGIEKSLKFYRFNSMKELLLNSDIVTVNTPLNQETSNLINESFLKAMKRGSYLINVSRGQIVKDENIIFKSLIDGHLEGFATDVWTSEPPSNIDHEAVKVKENLELEGKLIINPHTAYFSEESIIEAREKASKTCLNIIENKLIKNRISL